MNSITQNMKYRQSLMQYAEKYGVSCASRKYNKSRSYIYFWRQRWDGTVNSLACQSRRPHNHPNQHTDIEIKLIRNMRRRNSSLGLPELWHRLRKRGYTRRPESLFRLMRRLGLFKKPRQKKKQPAKPYEQMQRPGQRIQIDVKVVPKSCRANPEQRLFQYTAIDEYSRFRFLGAYEEQCTYSSADFLKKTVAFFKRKGIVVECVQTDNGFEFTNRFSNSKRDLQTLFEKRHINSAFTISSFAHIRLDITARSSAVTARIRSDCMIRMSFSRLATSPNSLLFTSIVPTIARCGHSSGCLLLKCLLLFCLTIPSNMFDNPTSGYSAFGTNQLWIPANT